MSKLYNAAKKAFFEPAKKAITKIAQKTSGQAPTRGQTIKYVKPKLTNLEGEKKKAVLKAKSDVQKSFGPVNERLRNQAVDMRQTLQKIRKKPITKSGISKGKDVTPGIYESASKGRKKLKFGGVSNRKSNVQKIKETFKPKKQLSAKQMKIAKLAGDPKKIDAKDLAKLRGRG